MELASRLKKAAEKFVQAQELVPRINSISEALTDSIVEELQQNIYKEVRINCEGCKIDHPSQTRHILCLFSTTAEWTDQFIDLVLLKLDIHKVMERWYPRLCELELNPKETYEAYKQWTELKASFNKHRVHFNHQLASMWSEKVKTKYNDGNS